MSTTSTTSAAAPAATRGLSQEQEEFAPIPFSRVVSVELRKMFDTRSGYWLMIAIGAAAALATLFVILIAPDDQLTYSTFASAIGVPMTVLLPVLAILTVTSEWSQRTGLTTFTYVPQRGRVITAKAVCAIGVGVVSIITAAGIGALGNVVGAAVNGTSQVWDVSVGEWAQIVLADVLAMMIGFMLGVLVRNSPGAIVGYFVYNFVWPTISGILDATQNWWHTSRPWFDFNNAQSALYDGVHSPEGWAQLGATGMLWVVLPLVIGVVLVMRSEVK